MRTTRKNVNKKETDINIKKTELKCLRHIMREDVLTETYFFIFFIIIAIL